VQLEARLHHLSTTQLAETLAKCEAAPRQQELAAARAWHREVESVRQLLPMQRESLANSWQTLLRQRQERAAINKLDEERRRQAVQQADKLNKTRKAVESELKVQQPARAHSKQHTV